MLGAFLGGAISQAASQRVAASPADVFGSSNVAIDTYRNSRGTYVLWSNGRITSAEGGAQDLGHPYRSPDPSARIGTPSLTNGQPLGSPNVAVRAIPRSDATYVLFSDGNLKRPAHADAAAGGGSGSRVILGELRWAPGTQTVTPSQQFTWQSNGGIPGGVAQLSDPMSDQAQATLIMHFRMTGSTSSASAVSTGTRSSDGRSFTFFNLMPPAGAADGIGQILIVDP